MTTDHNDAADTAIRDAIITLVKEERDCLDKSNLKGWMSLFCTDGVYWMPSHPGQTDPHQEISLLYEDRHLMEIRAENFGDPMSPAMAHPVRSCRLIEIKSVTPARARDGSWQALANFHAVLYHREEQFLFAGQYEYLVQFVEGRPLIKQKRVDLVNIDAPLRNIMIYI